MSDIDASSATGADETRQYLTFLLADVTYALPVEVVREIRGFTTVTPVPGSPTHILGVMNLRGLVIPVMDLRRRFGLEAKERDRFTVIILVQLGARIVGVVVDSVSDVLDVAQDAVGPVPELGGAIDQSYLAGMTTIETTVVLTLSVETIVGIEVFEDADPASTRAADAA